MGNLQTFVPGMVLCDRYELASVLGRGVMGQVWQARDLSLERPVAVKAVAAELLAVPSSREAAPARFHPRRPFLVPQGPRPV
ncbi:hypothetical protein ABZY06_04850 [Streptomyces sp. NPDC006540]|jgi:hypothetical protein|uniref:hypothetical protein n=1 Tax=Streptomyces sp. NPDC006540 TaxID=3155353 RepID=UPI0033A6DEE0